MAPKILFLGYFRYNSGSSNTLLGYSRAASELGYDLRVSDFGFVEEPIRRQVRVAAIDWKPDILVMVFESKQFLNEENISRIEHVVPRSRRILIDPDGKFCAPTSAGTDTNHPTAESYMQWVELYQRLSDKILQPSVTAIAPGAKRFLYFGLDTHKVPVDNRSTLKPFDIVYVGNNWYRWHDFVWLLEGISPVRRRVGRIALFGKHWFGDPKTGLENHTSSDLNFLDKHRVERFPSVPFGEVESSMSRGRLHPIFVRPVLNALGMVTPRMFETFAATTLPIIPPYFEHARDLYGRDIQKMILGENPAEMILEMLAHYAEFQSLAAEIRSELSRSHSYEVRLSQLLQYSA